MAIFPYKVSYTFAQFRNIGEGEAHKPRKRHDNISLSLYKIGKISWKQRKDDG